MFGFDAVHAHVGRELWARDNDRLVFVEPQQAEKLLGRLDISYHDGDVVEVFDHGLSSFRRSALRLSSLKQTLTQALGSTSRYHEGLPTPPVPRAAER
jgi:hypothetical protein